MGGRPIPVVDPLSDVVDLVQEAGVVLIDQAILGTLAARRAWFRNGLLERRVHASADQSRPVAYWLSNCSLRTE